MSYLPEISALFDIKLATPLKKPTKLWVDVFDGFEDPRYKTKVYLKVEPEEVFPSCWHIKTFAHLFDYVLTCEEELLDSLPNAVLFEYGSSSVKNYVHRSKKFAVSYVCGYKATTKNHILRKDLWGKQRLIKIPKDFYISMYGGVKSIDNNPVLGESKEPLFDSQFHICIENSCKKHYFTEKIIDAFLCKTIPIYLGCTGISNYFDSRGFFAVNSIDELIQVCNSLTERDYLNRLPYIDINYREALKWANFNERLDRKLVELCL